MKLNAPMQPNIPLIGKNSLMLEGLKQILEDIMPFAQFSIFHDLEEMQQKMAGMPVVHYFVSLSVYTSNINFFEQHKRQTILLIDSETLPADWTPSGITLNMLQPREQLLKQLLVFQQMGHHHYSHYPAPLVQQMKKADQEGQSLTPREQEVLRLLAQGHINKEIAYQLHISINTVITHRKHIMQKLNSQSLSKLAIYAVQHGIVDANDVK